MKTDEGKDPRNWYPGQEMYIMAYSDKVRIIRSYSPNNRYAIPYNKETWEEIYEIDLSKKCTLEEYRKFLCRSTAKRGIYYWSYPEEIAAFQFTDVLPDYQKLKKEFEHDMARYGAHTLFGLPNFIYPDWFKEKYPTGFLHTGSYGMALTIYRTKDVPVRSNIGDDDNVSSGLTEVEHYLEIKYSDKRAMFEHHDYIIDELEYSEDYRFDKSNEYMDYKPKTNNVEWDEPLIEDLCNTVLGKNYVKGVIKAMNIINLEDKYNKDMVINCINAINAYRILHNSNAFAQINAQVRRRITLPNFDTWQEFFDEKEAFSGPATVTTHKLICGILSGKDVESLERLKDTFKGNVVDSRVSGAVSYVNINETAPEIKPVSNEVKETVREVIEEYIDEPLEEIEEVIEEEEPEEVEEVEATVERPVYKFNVVFSSGKKADYQLYHFVVFVTNPSNISRRVYAALDTTVPMQEIACQELNCKMTSTKDVAYYVHGKDILEYSMYALDQSLNKPVAEISARVAEISAEISNGNFDKILLAEMKRLVNELNELSEKEERIRNLEIHFKED